MRSIDIPLTSLPHRIPGLDLYGQALVNDSVIYLTDQLRNHFESPARNYLPSGCNIHTPFVFVAVTEYLRRLGEVSGPRRPEKYLKSLLAIKQQLKDRTDLPGPSFRDAVLALVPTSASFQERTEQYLIDLIHDWVQTDDGIEVLISKLPPTLPAIPAGAAPKVLLELRRQHPGLNLIQVLRCRLADRVLQKRYAFVDGVDSDLPDDISYPRLSELLAKINRLEQRQDFDLADRLYTRNTVQNKLGKLQIFTLYDLIAELVISGAPSFFTQPYLGISFRNAITKLLHEEGIDQIPQLSGEI